MNTLEKLKKAVTDLEDDYDKFYNKGNASAGTRVRKALQEIKVIATEGRQAVTEAKSKGGEKEEVKDDYLPW